MAFEWGNTLLAMVAATVGSWMLFGWLPKMIETSFFRALVRMEALKRGDPDFHQPDLGDFIIRLRDSGRWTPNAARRDAIRDESFDPTASFSQAGRLEKAVEENVITSQQLLTKLKELADQQDAYEAANGAPQKGFSFRDALVAAEKAMGKP